MGQGFAPPLIKGELLSRYYHQGETVVKALDQIQFEIQSGSFTAIMGPSGSGKSTLMHLLGCLDRPTSGELYFLGENPTHLGDRELSRFRNKMIGFVFQSFHLLPYETILENVALPLLYGGVPRDLRLEKATLFLEAVGLGNRVDHSPLELSGGQCQRAAIARALVNSPKLLIADEPTGNLDSITGKEILSLFQFLHTLGMTLVMVTHDPEVAKYAQRVITMKDGHIHSDTTNPSPEKLPLPNLPDSLKELIHHESS